MSVVNWSSVREWWVAVGDWEGRAREKRARVNACRSRVPEEEEAEGRRDAMRTWKWS